MVAISGSYKALPPKFLAAAASVFPQQQYPSDEARWEAVFNFFAKDGKLTTDSFLDKLVKDLSRHALYGNFTADSEISPDRFKSVFFDWRGFFEMFSIEKWLRINDAIDINCSPRKFTSAFFKAIGRLATNNPNQTSFSKEEFVKFCQEWKKFSNLGK